MQNKHNKTKPLPNLEYLNNTFEISGESPTGLIWKQKDESCFPSREQYEKYKAEREGKPAGYLGYPSKYTNNRYFVIPIGGKIFKVHRIILGMYHGFDPIEFETDHINRNTQDNSIGNLRLVNRTANNINRGLFSTNKHNQKGIRQYKSGNWGAFLGNRGKQVYLGTFKTKEEAIAARKGAESVYHGEYGDSNGWDNLDSILGPQPALV